MEHVTHIVLTQWLLGRDRLSAVVCTAVARKSRYLSDAAAAAAAVAVSVLSGHVAHADQLVTLTCGIENSAELSANK